MVILLWGIKINPHGVAMRIESLSGYVVSYFISQISFVSRSSLKVW